MTHQRKTKAKRPKKSRHRIKWQTKLHYKTNPKTSKYYGKKKRAKNCHERKKNVFLFVVHLSPFKCKYDTISRSLKSSVESFISRFNQSANKKKIRVLRENFMRMRHKITKEWKERPKQNQHSKNLRAFVSITAIKPEHTLYVCDKDCAAQKFFSSWKTKWWKKKIYNIKNYVFNMSTKTHTHTQADV